MATPCAPEGNSKEMDNSERVRAYEIAAYLSAASFPLDIKDGPPASPVPSRDLTLNALVQHGVHMMNCDRAFLSLIDNRSQFICAEMTRYQPLGSQDPAQPLLLGIAKIPLEWGVCPFTMSVFHGHFSGELLDNPYIEATEKYFCIKDFRQVPSFAVRPFVAGYPHMVSYIEIPLVSLSGHILGSYCVVDDKLRDFLDPKALTTMREVTSTISSYLDLKRMEGGRTRSERMMDGLRQFIGSERHTPSVGNGAIEASGPQAGPFDLDVFSQTSQTNPIPLKNEDVEYNWSSDVNGSGNVSSGSTDTSPHGQLGALSLISGAPSISTQVSTPGLSEVKVYTSPSKSTHDKYDGGSSAAALKQRYQYERVRSNLSTQVGDLFLKAANLIGYAMNLDGLIFLDAITSSTQCRTSDPYPVSPVDERLHSYEDALMARSLAVYLGHDTADDQLVCQPTQSLIRRLISRYPQGHVFAVDEHGVLDYGNDRSVEVGQDSSGNSATRDEWGDLFECVPNARYAIFLPLWHYQRELCFATCLAWVSDTGKTLDSGDVNSLAAFGNSLMAEILRLEALTNTRSKSDFVSTISHELRSPLHGILATVELMQESTKDSHLLSMLNMIESCSSTLLDTFNHLLEFSKINSRAIDPKVDGTDQYIHRLSNARARRVPVDLSSLIEDVLETVSLGHLKLESQFKDDHQDPLAGPVTAPPSKSVLVTTNFQRHCTWVMRIDTGAWKRILMNIFSNALKYTKEGHIDVTLGVSESVDNGPRQISLSVTDTGIGMSHEFLKYHLFTPFMQENNLAPGTGLGLSIVKSIIESLGGKIFVDSHQGEGTKVSVNIPFDEEPETIDTLKIDDAFVPKDKLRGLSLGLLSIASPENPAIDSTPRIVSHKAVLQRSVRNICEGKFGMTVVDLSIGAVPDIDILLVDASALASTDKLDIEVLFRENNTQLLRRVVVVLGNPGKGPVQMSEVGLSSPITAKKLWAVLLKAIDTIDARETTGPILPTVLAEQRVPAYNLPTKDLRSEVKELQIELASPSRPVEHIDRLSRGPSPENTPNINKKPFQTPRPPQDRLSQNSITSQTTRIPAIACRFKHFLLVDDNAINLKILAAFAKRLGRPFATAVNGAEAVRMYQRAAEENDPFDCVFMDINMPVMDGFQAVAVIRRFEDEQQNKTHIPDSDGTTAAMPLLGRSYILALTGLGSEQARSSARDSGFDGFFLKPMRFKDIVPLLGPI